MLLCKKLILIRGQPPRQGGSLRATLNSREHLSLFPLVSPALNMSGVCCSASVPSRVFVMRSPLEISIMPSDEEWLLPTPSLAGSQTWMSSTTRGRRLTLGESLYYPIQWVESKDWATRELIRDLGYSGSSLPSCPSLSSDNLLYRKDFLQSEYMG